MLSGAAVVAAAALWLGVEVPAQVAVVGEVDAAGGLVGRLGETSGADAQTLLKLSNINGIRLLVVPASSESGRQVVAVQQRRSKLYKGVRAVAVSTLAEALQFVFSYSQAGKEQEEEEEEESEEEEDEEEEQQQQEEEEEEARGGGSG